MYIKDIENFFTRKNLQQDNCYKPRVKFLSGCNKFFINDGDSFTDNFQAVVYNNRNDSFNEFDTNNGNSNSCDSSVRDVDDESISETFSSLSISSLLSMGSEEDENKFFSPKQVASGNNHANNNMDQKILLAEEELKNEPLRLINKQLMKNEKNIGTSHTFIRDESTDSLSSIITINLDSGDIRRNESIYSLTSVSGINLDDDTASAYIPSVFSLYSGSTKSRFGDHSLSYSSTSSLSRYFDDQETSSETDIRSFAPKTSMETCVERFPAVKSNHVYPMVFCKDAKTSELVRIDNIYEPVRSFASRKIWFDDFQDSVVDAIEVVDSLEHTKLDHGDEFARSKTKKSEIKSKKFIFCKCKSWLKKKLTVSLTCF